MSEAKYTVKVQVPYELNTEKKAEILAEIRNALQVIKRTNPDLSLLVSSEFTDEELMESLRNNSQSREQCTYYDEAQGRHKCVNPVLKSRKCEGVCKDYQPK